MSADGVPVRLTVEQVEANWARILYTSGNPAQQVRVKVFVQDDGELSWIFPGHYVFILSEDWTTLVGVRTFLAQGSVLLHREAPDAQS